MNKGIFITFEGGDGAGKSTQIRFAKEFFEKRGDKVLLTREPGGTQISEKLRGILLDPENGEMSDTAEMLIYAAARAQLVREVIRPALEDGTIVICDRYVDSSIAYQGFGRGLGESVREVNRYAVDGIMPDLTLWMNIDPERGRERIGLREDGFYDRLEQEKADFHRRVYEGYRAIADAEPERVIDIDAAGTVEGIRAEIEKHLIRVSEGR